jgi:hypothetical protein
MKQMKNVFQTNPLFLAFVVPIIADVVGTVLGQPAEYWNSNYQVFNEALPIYPLLQIHPLVFIGVCLSLWLPFTYCLVKKLKSPLNLWATLSLLIGHGYNSVSWLRKDLYLAGIFAGQDQLSQALALIPMTIYILLIGWLATVSILAYFKRST